MMEDNPRSRTSNKSFFPSSHSLAFDINFDKTIMYAFMYVSRLNWNLRWLERIFESRYRSTLSD